MSMLAVPNNLYNFSYYNNPPPLYCFLETAGNNIAGSDDKQQYIDWYNIEKSLENNITINILSGSLRFKSFCIKQGFDYCISDAIDRYKRLNGIEIYNTTPYEAFLSALKTLYPVLPVITFFDDSAKARFILNQTEFVVDYDIEEIEPLYVSAYKSDVLVFKTCSLKKLKETLEQF